MVVVVVVVVVAVAVVMLLVVGGDGGGGDVRWDVTLHFQVVAVVETCRTKGV